MSGVLLRRILITGGEQPYEFSGKGSGPKAEAKFNELRRAGRNPAKKVQEFRRGQWRDVKEESKPAEEQMDYGGFGGEGNDMGRW